MCLRRVFVAWLFLLVAGCGAARRSEALRGPLVLEGPIAQQGEQLFMRECDYCHPLGDQGLGPALSNKPLPGPAIKLQVRKGVGAMPSFSEQELSNADVDAIAEYVVALRKSR
jgi:mono/diheme cytochrome c family protein